MSSEQPPKSKIEQIEEKLNQPNPAAPKAEPSQTTANNTTSILGEAQSAEDLMRALGIIK